MGAIAVLGIWAVATVGTYLLLSHIWYGHKHNKLKNKQKEENEMFALGMGLLVGGFVAINVAKIVCVIVKQ